MIEAGFSVDPRQLLLCETEVYGLISGPSWLRQTFVNLFEELGYVRNRYDKCIMSLPPLSWDAEKGKGTLNEGVVMIEVDDILEGGWSPRHKTLMENFNKRFVCGK